MEEQEEAEEAVGDSTDGDDDVDEFCCDEQ